MRLILSLLLTSVVLILIFSVSCFGFVSYSLGNYPVGADEITVHTLRGSVYWAIAWGLAGAVVDIVVGFVLALLSFLLRHWILAIFFTAICIFSVALWLYFLNIPVPLPE